MSTMISYFHSFFAKFPNDYSILSVEYCETQWNKTCKSIISNNKVKSTYRSESLRYQEFILYRDAFISLTDVIHDRIYDARQRRRFLSLFRSSANCRADRTGVHTRRVE